jgi:uncharacterized membrane protein
MTPSKQWWRSKTIWINILTLVAMIISQITGWEDMKSYAPTLLIVSNAINLVLRFISTAPIK